MPIGVSCWSLRKLGAGTPTLGSPNTSRRWVRDPRSISPVPICKSRNIGQVIGAGDRCPPKRPLPSAVLPSRPVLSRPGGFFIPYRAERAPDLSPVYSVTYVAGLYRRNPPHPDPPPRGGREPWCARGLLHRPDNKR